MADASAPRGTTDGWGPSTSVRSAAADAPAPRRRAAAAHASGPTTRSYSADPRFAEPLGSPWGSRPSETPSQTRASARERLEAVGKPARSERGIAGWTGLGVLIAVTILGILFDTVRGHQLGIGFNVGIIAGSILAILLVRRSGMFPVVVAPPIVYSLGAGISLYLRSGGLHDRGVLIDAATNWLVYGFPAIAAATASVLIIAGIRLIIRR